MLSFWNFAAKNLLRNKRRTISTAVAICVGFVGLNLLGAYIYRSKKALDVTSIYSAQRGHISILKKDAVEFYQVKPKKYVLNLDEQNSIQKILANMSNDVEYFGYRLTVSGLLSNGIKSHPVVIYGFDPLAFKKSLQQSDLIKWAKDWIIPSQLENLDIFINKPDTLSLTDRIADILSVSKPYAGHDDLQIAARSIDGDLNAINVSLGAEHTTGMQFLEDTVVLLPLKKVQELMNTDSVEAISIYLKPNINIDKFIEKFNSELKMNNLNIDIFKYDDVEINSLHQGTMGFLYVMGGFFVFLICSAVSLTIINSLTMGIIERTREIGTLRAVGFTVNHVVNLFLKEGILLSVFSMSAGIVFSFIIAEIVNRLNIKFFPPGASQQIQFVLNWNMIIACVVFLLLLFISWISSYVVIRQKMKVKLINLINDSGEIL